ncbi:hypothetical protein [Bradyrhizobium sp. C9]|uniref:hypothetical protein n=1 Tax=Bradyrhizobium sp. C9 TaxID=142585 RepID=UPI000BE9D553|nr:hypothetical protein [Bradyrhizobium sp. C9]PDT71453.1 hypothetical protein CO675_37125 [Bradyrhizobium sp. C9]
MARKPNPEFGKRRPSVPAVATRPEPPSKRSNHVALLMMGTLAVGGGAYALMPRQNCQPVPPPPPGVTAPAPVQPGADCAPHSSSSGSGGGGGGSSSRSSFYSGSSSSGGSSSSSGASSSSSVSRGGFGSFAHAFGFGGS